MERIIATYVGEREEFDDKTLPPNYFINNNYQYVEEGKSDAVSLYNYLRSINENKLRKKKNAEGALYRFPYFDGYSYIDTTLTDNYDLMIYTDRFFSGIRIRTVIDELLFNSIRNFTI